MDASWRLILDGEADGPWNMGLDEALLASAVRSGQPSLRLYRWRGPWLSLGYAQLCPPSLIADCAEVGVGIVRRRTGGRAVLHGCDLTYAVAAPEPALPSGLRATYARIGVALRAALTQLGVDAEASPAPAPDGPRAAFDCFAEPAADEVCVAGRKLIGSAQRRAGGGVLQHGSLRLVPDSEVVAARVGLRGNLATSLAEIGAAQPVEAVAGAIVEGFSSVFRVSLVPGLATDRERESARERRSELVSRPSRVGPFPAGATQERISPADTE